MARETEVDKKIENIEMVEISDRIEERNREIERELDSQKVQSAEGGEETEREGWRGGGRREEGEEGIQQQPC